CGQLTLKEANGDADRGLSLLYEKVTSHQPDQERLRLLRDALEGFRSLYSEDKKLTEALTPELASAPHEQRVEVAAWTLLTHSLLNLELAKVKR
ncbi:MAG: hypothetical protein N2C14_07270, partial [Planctomycetales bacterium]